jgi:hypothetical protein
MIISKKRYEELNKKHDISASIRRIEERLIAMEYSQAAVVAAAGGVATELNKVSEVMQIAETMERMVALLASMDRRNTVKKRA